MLWTMRGGRSASLALGHHHTASCLRTVVFLFLVTFVWLQLHMSNLLGSIRQDAKPANNSVQSWVPEVLHKFLRSYPRNENHHFSISNISIDMLQPSTEEIKNRIRRYNLAQTVLNEELFGPLQIQNDTIVIVIQVHTRLVYLEHLIESLAQARDIASTLLIFSHDFYDEEINKLVQSINFTKVMQIFYPFSIQTHPNEFPGDSPNDCPRDITIEKAVLHKCINALSPDLYGHYREAKFTQIKHHWWWKGVYVFTQLDIVKKHTGLVLFLEEDHYVAQDFLHVLRLMKHTAQISCPACNVFSLSTPPKTYNYFKDSRKAEVIQGFSNMGFAFNRSVWQDLLGCADVFCSYDDYNWDWSLLYVSQSCLQHKLVAMVMRGPRVFHIGECGVHHSKSNCKITSVVSEVQKVLTEAGHHLYPTHLTLTFKSEKLSLGKSNGGWGDVRDHQLCLNMTQENDVR